MGKWPTWLKTLWWAIITIALSLLMYKRLDNFLNGTNTATDITILFILFALYLTPLFSSIELPGIKLTQEIQEVKKEIEGIKNTILIRQENHSNVAPNFWFGAPPKDSSLPQIEENIRKVMQETLSAYGYSERTISSNNQIDTNDDINYMFNVRYNIEKELRLLAKPFQDDDYRNRFLNIQHLLGLLVNNEVINPKLMPVIREIYSVCSPAIHGESISQNQIDFVQKTAPEVIATLREIRKNEIRLTTGST